MDDELRHMDKSKSDVRSRDVAYTGILEKAVADHLTS